MRNDYRHSNRHAPRVTGSAMCVQRFDDSRNSAIRITYRISLRSSSLQEPRYPLLKVVFDNFVSCEVSPSKVVPLFAVVCYWFYKWRFHVCARINPHTHTSPQIRFSVHIRCRSWIACGNDPSAGSPTETLLRLHLPLDGKV